MRFQKCPRESGSTPPLEPLARESINAREEPDVLIDGEALVQGKALGHVADAPLDAFGVAAHVDAADGRGPARRLEQSAQHANRRRLARAVRAEEAEDLSLADVERQMIDGDEVAEAPREIVDD